MDMQDAELLREYVKNGSDAAFTELVNRYVGLVYSAARRQVSEAHLAEDIAQAVFCLLAQKAGALAGQRVLAGWLYRATCFTAARAQRAEGRQRQHEQEAAEMSQSDSTAGDMWEHLSPLLDQALNHLGEKDRAAVLLRFFQGKRMGEVGEALGLTEAAAKMRVTRSVEQMREFFAKRGAACSSSALALLLAEKGIEAAPAAMARGIVATTSRSAAPPALASLSLLQNLSLTTGIKASILTMAALCGLALLAAAAHFYASAHPSAASGDKPGAIVAGAALENSPARNASRPGFRRPTAMPARGNVAQDTADLAGAVENLRVALHAPRSWTSLGHGRIAFPRNAIGAIENGHYSFEFPSSLYPAPEVVEAIRLFGDHAREAFEVLKEAAGEPDNEVRVRAVSGVGTLGQAVPEAVPFLWAIARAPQGADNKVSLAPPDQSGSQHPRISERGIGVPTTLNLNRVAFDTLARIGFAANDIPLLAEVLGAVDEDSVKWRVSRCIAEVIRRGPSGAQPFIPAVEDLLTHTNAEVGFEAACALVQSRGAQDPRIFQEMGVFFDGLSDSASTPPGPALQRLAHTASTAAEILQKAGSSAKPLLPALLRLADKVGDYHDDLRQKLLVVAGTINGDLRNQLPEVDEALRSEE